MSLPNDNTTGLEGTLASVSAPIRAILERALGGSETSVEEATALSEATGRDLFALCLTADRLRHEQVGDVVTYVVNRNINFTNVCVKACKFCAFARGHRSEQGYFLDMEEIVRRAVEAASFGATEVCLQAGLAPGMDGGFYIDLCKAVKAAAPGLDIHAFSPEEVKYGAGLSGQSIRDYLSRLKDAGLGSLPGTSAEILDDALRDRIAPGRIRTEEWLEVIRAAHDVGLPTTSTLMFGHVETAGDCVRHIDLLRSIQKETGGFTELVPLSFVHEEAPMFARSLIPGLRAGPTGNEVIRLFAIARLMLGRHIKNLQAPWVKEGLRQAQWLLSCGANDLGGTLINESISTSAGAHHGQLVSPGALRATIRDAGRIPAQRDTRYRLLKTFPLSPTEDEARDALDTIEDPDALFGNYESLTGEVRFRFKKKPREADRPPNS